MKPYTKPVLLAEVFTVNEAVSACDRLPTDDYEYKATTVECLATTSDKIFTEGTSGCDHVVDPKKNGQDYMFINYTDNDNRPGSGLYFAWLAGGKGNPTSELKEVMRSVGITDLSPSNGIVWHCGPVSDYLKQIYSHS